MPIIVVRNWPSKVAKVEARLAAALVDDLIIHVMDDNSYKRKIAEGLRKAVMAAEVPGIDFVELVTVSFDQGRVLEDDQLLVVEVVGLFDRPDRTKEVRDRLGNKIKAFINKLGPVAEVLVHRFNPEVDSYVRG